MAAPVPVLDDTVVQAPDDPSRLLVLVHGYGEPVESLTDRLALLDPDRRFLVVAPKAPFEHKGRAIWHRALHAGEVAAEQFLAGMAAIDDLLGRLEAAHGLAASDAVVGGFSQGGGLGIALLLGADVVNRPAAAFGVCSFPPHVDGFRVSRRAAASRPCLLASAHRDHFAPIDVSRAGAVALRHAGLDVTYAELPGEHVMTDDAARLAGRWLAAFDDGARLPDDGAEHLTGVGARADYLEQLWELVT